MNMMVNPYVFASAPPATSYANAGGTGDRTASITLSTNTIIEGGGSMTALINGTMADSYYWTNVTGDGSGWIKFDFGSGVSKVIDEFNWYQDISSAQGTWRFEGSNDNSSWTQCGSDFTLNDSTAGSGTAFSVSNTTAYRYYRLRHMSGARNNAPYLREIEFKIV